MSNAKYSMMMKSFVMNVEVFWGKPIMIILFTFDFKKLSPKNNSNKSISKTIP